MSGVSLDGRGGFFNSNLGFAMAAGLGAVPGAARVVLLGHNPDIDTGTDPEDVWGFGGLYPFQSTAQTLEVLSSSVNDTSVGTGARTVLISGLDANYNTITEVKTLNGVTPVTTTNQFLRVNIFTTTSSGSTGYNEGNITLRVAGGGNVQNYIELGYGFGRTAVYTVPAGFTFFMTSAVFSVNTAPGATPNACTFGLHQRSSTGNSRIPLEFQVTSTTPYMHETKEGLVLSEKTDFTLRAQIVRQDNTDVTAAAAGILFDNTRLVGM